MEQDSRDKSQTRSLEGVAAHRNTPYQKVNTAGSISTQQMHKSQVTLIKRRCNELRYAASRKRRAEWHSASALMANFLEPSEREKKRTTGIEPATLSLGS